MSHECHSVRPFAADRVFEIGALALFLSSIAIARADAPIRMRETFAIDYQYHVSCRVHLSGQLTVPPETEKDKPTTMDVRGTSAIEYDERVLQNSTAEKPAPKTLRLYRRVDLDRTVGDKPQEATLRPSVRRLVILRTGHREVPFSPDGPLTWAEIDLVRTDVFTPALAAMLPDNPVSVGDHWKAGIAAIEELTDIEKIDEGGLDCRFDEITTLAGRRLARIRFNGTIKGVNDDGPNKQSLDGYFYFDLGSNHISYLTLDGTSYLLDKEGKTTGQVKGQFVLTRQVSTQSPDLADDALRRLNLEPNADNTLLLYDNPDLGIRFLYPRRWHVGQIRGRQITLDEPAGNGLMISLEAIKDTPTAADYLAENKAFLVKQKAEILGSDPPRRLGGPPNELEQFGLDVSMSGQKARMEYFVGRQLSGGFVVAARLMPRDLANVRGDVERIVRSVQVGKKE
jgi:hypothetical protein